VNIVRVGTNNLQQPESEYKDYQIEDFISHPEYDSENKINDVALIRVKNDIR
jgi:hypothetical protein